MIPLIKYILNDVLLAKKEIMEWLADWWSTFYKACLYCL